MAAGPRVLVTRPQPMASVLAAALEAADFAPVVCPMLGFESCGEASVEQVHRRLHQSGTLVIFVSPAAVQYGLGAGSDRIQSVAASVLAVGPGTAAALREFGIGPVVFPEHGRPGSESLLALPAMQSIEGTHVVIVQGDRPRGLLQQTLHNRGARVEELSCYRTLGPAITSSEFIDLWRNAPVEIVLLTSVGGFQSVMGLLTAPSHYVTEMPFVAVSDRIADAARDAGWAGPCEIAERSDSRSLVGATRALAERIGQIP